MSELRLQAVDAGTCPLAVASGLAVHEFGRPTVAATWPRPGYFDVVAAGVGRHARSPDAARSLAEWLLGDDAQAAQFDAIGLRPANPAGLAGSLHTSAASAAASASCRRDTRCERFCAALDSSL